MINNQFFKYVQLLHEKYTRKPEYNLFRVLRSESDEVRLHSRFLADLLNPKGSHYHSGTFLKSFLMHLKEKKNLQIDLSQEVTVNAEYKNIDILIRSGKTAIVIENKIYASDQEKQLSNYYKEMKEEGYENIKLIYLTRTGYEPSDQSTDELPDKVKEKDLTLASYKNDIYEWISRCTELAARDAPLREACIQYLDIISKITNKIENQDHMDELKTLLLTDNNLARVPDLFSAYNEVLTDLQLDIWNKIAEGIKREFGELNSDSITMKEDSKGLVRRYVENKQKSKYLCIKTPLPNYKDTYILVEQDHHMYFGISCKNGSTSPEYKNIKSKTKSIISPYPDDNLPIWLYTKPKINFKSLIPKHLSYLAIEDNRQQYADEIVQKLKEITETLKQPS